MMQDRLESALLRGGLAAAVFSKSSDGQVATVIVRAAGHSAKEKEDRMHALAWEVLRRVPGKALIARQYLMVDGKFGHAWNISVFGEQALEAVEFALLGDQGPAGPSPAAVTPVRARQQQTAVAGAVAAAQPGQPGQQLRRTVYSRGKNKIEEMVLPHVRRGRNQYKPDPSAPLGIGKGATPVLELRRVQTGGR